MSKLTAFIKALIPVFPSQREMDDAYLAASVDIYDLERRITEIDRRHRTVLMGAGNGRLL